MDKIEPYEEEVPTQNAIWKKYTLFWHPIARKVLVEFKHENRIPQYCSREEAEKGLKREGIDTHGQMLYYEILKMYEDNDPKSTKAGDEMYHLQKIKPIRDYKGD